jgi:flagellum-specific peptidoglycan hydrolase FlgJ
MIKSKLSKQEPEETEPEETEPEETEQIPDMPKNSAISDFYKKVVETLPDYNEETRLYITAQAMHETGNFTSELFKEHNNAFGMMFPRIRETTAVKPTEQNFASYNNIEDSIKDVSIWQEYNKMPETFLDSDMFVKWLKDKGYFTDKLSTYTNAVRKHLQNLRRYAQ